MNVFKEAAPEVSIIVPVYQVEKYINRCVRSIIEQDYKNIEIILIDDGAKDDSGRIIDEIALQDNRIKVIHQENRGVSSARNQGLKAASGEYILFVDGDDYIERDYVGYFLELIEKYDVNMAVGMNNFTVDSNTQTERDKDHLQKDVSIIEEIYLGKLNVAVWNKIYKNSIIKKNHIKFHEDIWYGEGMLFNIEYLQCVEEIAVGYRRVYHQVVNPDSATRSFNLESNFCGIRSLEIQKAAWKKVTPEIELAWRYHYRNFSEFIICGLTATGEVENHKDVYDRCVKSIRSDLLLPWKVHLPLGRKLRIVLFSIMPRRIANRRKKKAIRAAEKQEKELVDKL